MSIVDELVTLLGLEVDQKASGEAGAFGKLLGGITTGAAAAGAALVAAAGAIGAYAVVQAEAIDQAGKMADAFGINFGAFQELEYAAQQSGAEVEEFRADLENLSKTLDDNDALKELGVNAKDATGKLRSTDEVLMDIAEKFEDLSKGEQNKFTDQLGLSPSALKVLQQGTGGLEGLRSEAKRLGLVLDETAKNKAAKFQSSLINARSVVNGLGKAISVGLLPAMSDSLDKFTEWVGANREFISSAVTQVIDGVAKGFDMFGDAVSYVYEQVLALIGPIDQVLGPLDATQAIAIAVAIAMGALAVATLAATWPYLLMAVAIGAIIIVLDDLYSAFTGGDSVIGGWVQQFQQAFPAITGAIGKLIDILGVVSSIFTGALVEGIKYFAATLGDIFGAVVDQIANVMNAIEQVIAGANPFDVLGELFTKQFDIIMDLAGKIGKRVVGIFKDLFGSSEGEGAQADAGAGGGRGSSAQVGASAQVSPSVIQGKGGGGSTSNETTINVNGAGDPSAVASEVVKRSGLGQTLQQSSPGMTGPTVG